MNRKIRTFIPRSGGVATSGEAGAYRARRLPAVSLLLPALFASAAASAAITCTGTGVTTRLALPTTVVIPRDTLMPVGTLLTPWVAGPERDKTFTCDAPAGAGYLRGVSRNPSTLVSAGITVPAPPGYNLNVNVAQTAVPGVGIAVYYRPYSRGWQPGARGALPVWGQTSADWTGTGAGTLLGGQIYTALVKTAGAVSAGTVAATEIATVLPTVSGSPAGGSFTPDIYSIPAIRIEAGACVIPSDTRVDLGDQKRTAFTAHGATGPWVDFRIPVTGCPAALTAIQYGLRSVHGLPPDPRDSAKGVVAIAPGGATGIGIQLWDNRTGGYVPAYPTRTGMRGFVPGTAAYSLDLRARMYQTLPATQPGPVDAQVEITMVYR